MTERWLSNKRHHAPLSQLALTALPRGEPMSKYPSIIPLFAREKLHQFCILHFAFCIYCPLKRSGGTGNPSPTGPLSIVNFERGGILSVNYISVSRRRSRGNFCWPGPSTSPLAAPVAAAKAGRCGQRQSCWLCSIRGSGSSSSGARIRS